MNRTSVYFERSRSLLALLVTQLGIAGVAYGQVAPSTDTKPKEDSEVIELSPFVVDARRDTGYQATNTLGGTRLRTNLGDLATAIQVVTKEMLQDTGSSSASEILVYTTGTEVTGTGGNFTSASTNSIGNTTERQNFRVPNTRVRGLASASLTRDYFLTSIPFDSYNTERVEINRGANATLFGLGSPAGIINNALSQAQQRNFGSISYQIGSYDSQRQSIDLNVAPGKGFAVRAAGLYDEQKYQQKPAFATDRRGYVAALWEPEFLQKKGALSGVALRANYEGGSRDSNAPRTIPVGQNYQRWFDLGKPTWDPPVDDLTTANRDIYNHIGVFRLITMWPNVNSSLPGQGTVGIVQPSRPPSATTGQPIFATFGSIQRLVGYLARRNGDPFIVDPAISDENVFDFRNNMIDGPNKHESIDFSVLNVATEFRFFQDKAGLELGYNTETFTSGAFDWFRANSDGEVYIDYNLRMFDGTPNPNFGRPFIGAEPVSDYAKVQRESKRVNAYYSFDSRDVLGERWGKWFGKHTVTLGATEYTNRSFSKAGLGYISDGEMLKYQGSAAVDFNNGSSPMWIYLGPSVANATSSSQIRLQPVTVEMRPDQLTTNQSRFIVWNPATNRWENQPVQIYRQDPEVLAFPNFGDRTKNVVNSKVAVLQSNILQDTVVFTGSWRADESDSYNIATPPTGPRGELLLDELHAPLPKTPTLSVEGETLSWGVVAKTPRRFLKHIPWVSEAAILYNSSENFAPSGARFNVYGAPIGAPSGKTQDYGVSLGLFDNKLTLRATKYKTEQVGVSAGMFNVISNVARIEAGVLSRIREGYTAASLQNASPGITQAEVDRQKALWLANPFPYASRYFVNPNPPAGQEVMPTVPSGTDDTFDLTSRGIEFEAIYNPLRNWRIAFNAAKQEAMQNNTGTTTLRFIQERAALWTQTMDLPVTQSYAANVRSEYLSSVLAQYYRIANRDGTLLSEVRKWRFNVLTNYDFDHGFLKGWGVGGAYRWEDKAGVGYQTFFDSTLNIWRIDPTKPWYSPARDHVDAWISYARKISKGKVLWKTQLNVRNVLDEDSLVTIYRNPDGTPARFSIPEGRRWELSTRFEF